MLNLVQTTFDVREKECQQNIKINFQAVAPSYGSKDNPGLSCLELYNAGKTASGYYFIKPSQNMSAFEVKCNLLFCICVTNWMSFYECQVQDKAYC